MYDFFYVAFLMFEGKINYTCIDFLFIQTFINDLPPGGIFRSEPN